MISDNTGYLKLPLPHKDNYLEDDVPRLRDAFEMLDGNAAAVNSALQTKASGAAMTQALAGKADAQTTSNALANVNNALGGKLEAAAFNALIGASFLQLPGGVGPFRINIQDGSGRVNFYWNTAGGTAPAFAAAGEDALRILLGTGGGSPQFFYAPGAGKNAGDAIVWQDLGFEPSPAWKNAVAAAQTTANATKAVTDLVTTVPAAWRIPQAGADGKLALGWIGGGGGMIPVGHIAFLPFRFNQLPQGWYFCNGTRYANGGAQANVLNALSNEFKADWGIINNGSTTNVPNWFYGGRGPAMRGVDGSSRQVGSVEDGAIQNITGSFAAERLASQRSGWNQSGALYATDYASTEALASEYKNNGMLHIDVSRVVATANEVRMLNRGMTPAIFLGV